MRTSVIPSHVLGQIDLRLSAAQLRMLKLENQKILTVPIYADIENAPPAVAIEGQVALSQADLKVWWFSNAAWHTCAPREGLVWEQLDGDLELFAPGGTDEWFTPGTLTATVCKGPDGKPWCAFMNGCSAPLGSLISWRGPFVKRWDGTTFHSVPDSSSDGGLGDEQIQGADPFITVFGTSTGLPSESGTYSNRGFFGGAIGATSPEIPYIACDGSDVYVLVGRSENGFHSTTPVYERTWWMVKKWDGSSWSFLGTSPNTHQVSIPVDPWPGPGITAGSTQLEMFNLPKLVASLHNPGHPCVLYLDRLYDGGTGGYTDYLYCAQWDGSSWNDLGGALDVRPTAGVASYFGGVDIGLGSDGQPTVIWDNYASDHILVRTWTGSHWVDSTFSIDSVFGTSGAFVTRPRISIQGDVNPDGKYRFFIAGNIRESGNEMRVAEYFPATHTVRPLFNDVVAALDTDILPWELFPFKPERSDKSVWVFSTPGNADPRMEHYDNVCVPHHWESLEWEPSDPYGANFFHNGYFDPAADKVFYTCGLEPTTDFPFPFRTHVWKATIVVSDCP